MRLPQRTLRRASAPALIALQALILASCESGGPFQPQLSPEAGASNMLNQYHYAKSVTISIPDTTLVPGRQVQATAEVRDQDGLVVSWAPVTWSVAGEGIATISSNGLITAGETLGRATISAFSDGVTATRTIRVDPPWDKGDTNGDDPSSDQADSTKTPADADSTKAPADADSSETPAVAVRTISISVNATALKAGETTQISGVVRDVEGTPIPDVPIVWSTAETNVATVATTSPTAGVVTAKGAGTTLVYARADTVVRSITLTVAAAEEPAPAPSAPVTPGGSGSSYGSATPAALPRASVSTTYPSPSRQVRVPADGNLQAAIDAAQPGDELLLPPGAAYYGNFYLRNKGASGSWITIRTDLSDAAIGAPGTRMTPSRAANARLAKIVTPNIYSAITSELGANHYRFTGVEIAVGSSVTDMNALVRLGESEVTQNSMSSIANNLVLDRTYIHGNPTGQLKRCVMLNSATTAIVDSWLGDCHSNVSDSQAILGWNGPGPYLIQNNHLEAGHEVIMFGGNGTTIQGVSPSDITIRGNHIMRPASWKGVWQVKNLIESKHARRVLIEGNVIENTWADAQAGFAFVLKSENQNWDTPWTQTSDITIRYNKIRNVGGAFNIAASPSGAPALPTTRLVITDNVIENVGVGQFGGDGRTFQLLSGISDIVLMHNTVVSAAGANPATIYFGGPGISRLVVHSNVLHHGYAGVKGDATGEGTASLNTFAAGALFSNNAMAYGGSAGTYPANNWFPATLSDIGFVNLAGGDYHLSSSSSYANKGYDGRNIGADIDQVNAATRGAVVAP